VTRENDAHDLEPGVFKFGSAKKIATSLKRSAERSRGQGRRISLGLVNADCINRAGKTLPKIERNRLERAKVELKRQFETE
jgi:hypothetical protein